MKPGWKIFAFGTVLYEMVAGKRPFEGKTQISLASSILEADPEPVSKLKPGTPLAIQLAVTTCLQKNPKERYQTAHDLARGRTAPIFSKSGSQRAMSRLSVRFLSRLRIPPSESFVPNP
jgi:serine/threonine protein kinase